MVIAMHYIDIGVIILQHEINPKTLKEEKHFTVSYMYTDFCGTCINMISRMCDTIFYTQLVLLLEDLCYQLYIFSKNILIEIQ